MSQPILNWWMQHWMDASHPLARLQRAWMESTLEAIQVEAEFLSAWNQSSRKVAECLSDPQTLFNPATLTGCYRQAATDLGDAQMTRLGKVAELPQDFKDRIWEEIC
ncbi:hypothetical protein [Halomonas sp. RA08-2]|uniref:hypothetical protein n=1 Tax=Halomonas sp. RA08-2 TaxID=3440842 RepID=UPI003EEFFD70